MGNWGFKQSYCKGVIIIYNLTYMSPISGFPTLSGWTDSTCMHPPACPSLPRRCYKPERAELRAHLTDVVSGLNGATVGWVFHGRGLSKTPTAITYPTKISLRLGRLFGKLEKLGDRLTGHIRSHKYSDLSPAKISTLSEKQDEANHKSFCC